MMLVAGMVLVGPASAYTGQWHYDQNTGWKVGAYCEHSNYNYGIIYAGSSESTAGSNDLAINLEVLGTDASSNPTYSTSGYTKKIISSLRGYYGTHDLTQPQYNPKTENLGKVGTGYHTVEDYPDW